MNASTETKKRVLYIDLDGTVRKGFGELGKFVNFASDVEIFPKVRELDRKSVV